MPSQANIFGPAGGEFISDATPQTVTLNVPGGSVLNNGAVQSFLNLDNGAVVTTEGNNPSVVPLPPGATKRLPAQCVAFKHATNAGSTFLIYEGSN